MMVPVWPLAPHDMLLSARMTAADLLLLLLCWLPAAVTQGGYARQHRMRMLQGALDHR